MYSVYHQTCMCSSDVACAVLTRFTGVEMRGSPPLAPHHFVCVETFTLPYLTFTFIHVSVWTFLLTSLDRV